MSKLELIDLDRAECNVLFDRYEKAIRLRPFCPKCKEDQQQILDWFCEPTKWKCRICKHEYTVAMEGR